MSSVNKAISPLSCSTRLQPNARALHEMPGARGCNGLDTVAAVPLITDYSAPPQKGAFTGTRCAEGEMPVVMVSRLGASALPDFSLVEAILFWS